jgi:hypothetical protein
MTLNTPNPAKPEPNRIQFAYMNELMYIDSTQV